MSKYLNIKDKITDGIGLAVWILGGYLLYQGVIDFLSFCGMFVLGGILFYVPDEWVTKRLKEWLKKKFSVK